MGNYEKDDISNAWDKLLMVISGPRILIKPEVFYTRLAAWFLLVGAMSPSQNIIDTVIAEAFLRAVSSRPKCGLANPTTWQ